MSNDKTAKEMKDLFKDESGESCIIGELMIRANEDTPDIFSCSPYYVDYEDFVCTKTVPMYIYSVREWADPIILWEVSLLMMTRLMKRKSVKKF